IDNDTPAYNEWFDNCEHLVACDIKIQDDDDDDDDDDDRIPTESPPKIMEAMEMLSKLHLLATTQESQLHQLISQLESKLTDVYIHSKAKKTSKIRRLFKAPLNPVFYLKRF
ncbi:unnamed protein product, partial [Rotaria socialis]